MIYIGRVLLSKFVIDTACLSLYCISVIDLRVTFIYFHFYDNIVIFNIYRIYYIYKEFFNSISSADLADNLPHFIFDLLYLLASMAIYNFLPNDFSDAVTVKMFTNFLSIIVIRRYI